MPDERPTATIRPAREDEVPRIVELIHLGDVAGRGSEQPGPPFPGAYAAAFREIRAAPNQEVYVAELDGEVVGTFQLAILANLSNVGRRVAQIESVHVAPEWRNHGIGEQMLSWAIAEARRQGCFRLQFTSHHTRTDAHRFYERLGFVNSHVGMKLDLAVSRWPLAAPPTRRRSRAPLWAPRPSPTLRARPVTPESRPPVVAGCTSVVRGWSPHPCPRRAARVSKRPTPRTNSAPPAPSTGSRRPPLLCAKLNPCPAPSSSTWTTPSSTVSKR